MRQYPGAPTTLPEGLTPIAAAAAARLPLALSGAALNASAEDEEALRQAVRATGVTALQVNLSQASDVSVVVRDLSGRVMWHQETAEQAPGTYVFRWSGSTDGGGRARPGVYLVVVRAQGHQTVSKLILTAQRN